MVKKPSVAKLKKKADTIFSQYIRMRDADQHGTVTCISCPKRGHWKEFQNGHFVSRNSSALRFDDENCNAQCLTAESKLRMFNGTNKSIAKVKVGDELWAFSEHSFGLEKATVETVKGFVPNKLYEVEMEDGSKFWATPDHRVIANDEWAYIEDMLHNVSAYDILEL